MKKRNIVKAALASAAIAVAAATPALAGTYDVGGGKWSYDVGANTAWSNYYHWGNIHSSSLRVDGNLYGSGCTGGGKWSLASAAKGSERSFYYNPSCY